MQNPIPVFTALLPALMLAASQQYAYAQASASARAPAASSVADANQTLTLRRPIERRPVRQAIAPTPRIVTGAERPATLVPRAPGASAASPPAPVAPSRINSCDAGGCLDTSGARYNGGVGNTLISPQGRLCIKGVVNAQCF